MANCSDCFTAKRKREEEKTKKENMDKGISNYFTKGPVVAQPKAKVCHSSQLVCNNN